MSGVPACAARYGMALVPQTSFSLAVVAASGSFPALPCCCKRIATEQLMIGAWLGAVACLPRVCLEVKARLSHLLQRVWMWQISNLLYFSWICLCGAGSLHLSEHAGEPLRARSSPAPWGSPATSAQWRPPLPICDVLSSCLRGLWQVLLLHDLFHIYYLSTPQPLGDSNHGEEAYRQEAQAVSATEPKISSTAT